MVESKKPIKKKSVIRTRKDIENELINNKIIENFVALQRVMTNLAIKFDSLSTQISKLLELFEISAKSLSEKDFSLGDNKLNNQISEKLDNLLEQNKVIAKGITLLHEKEQNVVQPVTSLNPPAFPTNSQFLNQGNQSYKPRTVPLDSLGNPINQRYVKPLE